MGKVYAWKLVCGNNILYSYLSSGGTYTTGDCFEIPPCSADYARSLQTEEAYAEAFNEMLLHIPTQFLSTLKHYSAYWNIGCDKPKDWKPCDGSGGGSWITCDATATFSETSVVVPYTSTEVQISYTLSNQDSYELISSNPEFVINSKTTSGARIVFTENTGGSPRETILTLTAKKIGCPDISKTMNITQTAVSCDVFVTWETSSVVVNANQTSVVVGYSVENEESYTFIKSGFINNIVDNRNGTVTIYFDESTSQSVRTGNVLLRATKRGCQDSETTLSIRQNGISCDVIANFPQSSKTVASTDTSFVISFSVSNQDSHVFEKSGFITSVIDLGDNTIRVSFSENETQTQRTGVITLKARKNGCPDATATLNVVQRGISCNNTASFASSTRTVNATATTFDVSFTVSGQDSYNFVKGGIVTDTIDLGNGQLRVVFTENQSVSQRAGSVTLNSVKSGCDTATAILQITQSGIECNVQASFSETAVTVDATAITYTVGFSVLGQDSYSFDGNESIVSWRDNGNNTVTMTLNPNETYSQKTSSLLLSASKNGCPTTVTSECIIRQRGKECDSEVKFVESAATVDYNATSYTVGYSKTNVSQYGFAYTGETIQRVVDNNNGTATIELQPNETQDVLVGTVTITGTTDGCPSVADTFTITQLAGPDPCDFSVGWLEDSVTVEAQITRVRLNYAFSGTTAVEVTSISEYVTDIHQYGGGVVDIDIVKNDSLVRREIPIILIGRNSACPTPKEVVCIIFQKPCEPILSVSSISAQADTQTNIKLTINSWADCEPRDITVAFPELKVEAGTDYSVNMDEYINNMLISYNIVESLDPEFYGYTHTLNLTVNANVLSGVKAISEMHRDILLRSNLALTVRVTQRGTDITQNGKFRWSPTRPEYTGGRKVAQGFYLSQVVGCGVQYFAVCFPKNAEEFVTKMKQDMSNDPAVTKLTTPPTGVARCYYSNTDEWDAEFLSSPDIEWYSYDWSLGDTTSRSYFDNARGWPIRDAYDGVIIYNKTYSDEDCGYKFVVKSGPQRDCSAGTSYIYVRSIFLGNTSDISVTFNQMYAFSSEGIRELSDKYNEFCPSGFVVQRGSYTYEGEQYTHRIRITTEMNNYTTSPESLVIAFKIIQTESGNQEIGRCSIMSC